MRHEDPPAYTIKIVKPGHDDVLVGPIYYTHNAESWINYLNWQRSGTAMPDGTTWEAVPYDPARPHTPPPPTDVYALAEAIMNEPYTDPEAAFPDTFSLLYCAAGPVRAHDLWKQACAYVDHLTCNEEED